jgi:hypothetical protein
MAPDGRCKGRETPILSQWKIDQKSFLAFGSAELQLGHTRAVFTMGFSP